MGNNTLTDDERDALKRLHGYAQEGNHYRLLNVPPDADTDAVRAAYYQVSREWHPDRHYRRDLGDLGGSIEFIFSRITKAYKILGDPEARRQYNRDNKAVVAAAKADHDAAQKKARRAKAAAASGNMDEKPKRRKKLTPEERAARLRARKRMERRSNDPRAQALKDLRKKMKGQASRAQRYYDQGKADYDADNVSKAVASLHLACQFDKNNHEFRALYELAKSEVATTMAVQFVQAGESAESFQNFKEALYNYQRACEQNPKDGLPYFRLAQLVLRLEQDSRKALDLLRSAASKSPRDVNIRLALADLYVEIGMGLNARREYETVLEMDKGNSRAKTGLRSVR
jgi:curved DNA-binding protein CbpA